MPYYMITYLFNLQQLFPHLALHYAIQEHRTDTAKLLLEYKADPTILSKWGDDALQTSCLKVRKAFLKLSIPFEIEFK